MKRLCRRGAGLLLLGLLPSWAAAQTCSVSASATAFGSYSPLSASNNDANGSVTLTCSANALAALVSYTASLSSGGASSFSPRKMSSSGHLLQYQLYTSVARSTVWGDGTGGTSTVAGTLLTSALLTTNVTLTVYGRIPGSQSTVAAGSCSDTITVTVAY